MYCDKGIKAKFRNNVCKIHENNVNDKREGVQAKVRIYNRKSSYLSW